MNTAWKQLHPQDSFTVKLNRPVTIEDEQVLSYLYQPIIGIEAFGLYHAFLTAIPVNDFESDEQFHSELFNQLNIDLPSVFKARVKLEGLGLLRVFVKEEGARRQFLYELYPPQTAAEFLKDTVLSLLLVDKIGEERYEKLTTRFAIPKVDRSEYQEITKKFVDVYQWNQEGIHSQEKLLSETKEKFTPEDAVKPTVTDSTFDWSYFLSLLDSLYVDKTHLETEVKEMIVTVHRLYGIDELEMKKILEPEIDYVTNQVNIKQFRQSIIKKYHVGKKQTKPETVEDNTLTSEDQETKRRNTLLKKGYSEGEVQVILSSETIKPMVFLSAIKKQKGGFVAIEERWAVENLVRDTGLPDAVINVLIHFVLVVKDNATFAQKYANAIANDWAQAGIKKPEDAVTKAKEVSSSKAKKTRSYGSKGYNNKSVRKESVPEWVGKERDEKPISKESDDFINEKIRKLREKKKEGES